MAGLQAFSEEGRMQAGNGRGRARARLAAAAALVAASVGAQAQAWKPDQTVELVVTCAPGCGPDRMVRFMQRTFQTRKLVDPATAIVTKAGGGGAVAHVYLNQFPTSGHHIIHTGKIVVASHAMGRTVSSFTQLTPIANLFGEYIAVAVRTESPIVSGRDLIARLKKDPAALSFGIATTPGGTNHQAVAGPLKAAGVDIRKMRNVIFNSGALAITAMLGGHVDAVPVSIGSWVPHMKAGRVRVIAVSSAERLPGFFADVPTWREQGADSVVSNWRAIFGPKNMGAPQVAYWENVFRQLVETQEWKDEMASIHGMTDFMPAARFRKYIDEDYRAVESFLLDLGLISKPPR